MGTGDPILAYGDVAVTDPAQRAVEDVVTQGQLVALDSQAVSFGPKQVIDALFEPGWYDDWQALRQDTPPLRQRTAANQTRYRRFEQIGATSQLAWDIRTLNSIAKDYDETMTRAGNGERIDVKQARAVHAMYSSASLVVEYDNDALDAAFEAGVVAGFLLFPFVVMQDQAQRLQELLKVLKRELELAKKKLAEAWQQAAVDLVVTAISLMPIPLGLVARGGLLIAQSLFDTAMGPSTSNLATAGSNESKAGEFASAVAEVRANTQRERTIAKGGGKVATFAGFAFDANEIFVGYEGVDRIANAVREVNAAAVKLNGEIAKYSPVLQDFVEKYKAWQISIADLRTQADIFRRALEDDLRANRYNVR